jgi:hypothetical protein
VVANDPNVQNYKLGELPHPHAVLLPLILGAYAEDMIPSLDQDVEKTIAGHRAHNIEAHLIRPQGGHD